MQHWQIRIFIGAIFPKISVPCVISLGCKCRDDLFEYHWAVVEQLDQLEVCLPYRRLLAGIPILAVFQNLRWKSNKTSLMMNNCLSIIKKTLIVCLWSTISFPKIPLSSLVTIIGLENKCNCLLIISTSKDIWS